MPLSRKRMSEIERELAVIARELDRIEKARAERPEQSAVQCPWAPPLLELCRLAQTARQRRGQK